ncbi:MAG: hypothetical protein ISR51_08665 [Rhodospirillales bacterium]|nr:hypothetical protein [Rhodospirillales bacterium]
MSAANGGNQSAVSYLINECGENVSAAACFIHDWQTLIAGLLALVAAIFTVLMIRRQINLQKSQIEEDRKRFSDNQRRKGLVARVHMPDALSELCTYSEGCLNFLRDPENVENLPTAPDGAINTIKTAIEFVDPKPAEGLFDLVKHYQIHNARLSKDLDDGPHEITDRMYDTIYLRGFWRVLSKCGQAVRG